MSMPPARRPGGTPDERAQQFGARAAAGWRAVQSFARGWRKNQVEDPIELERQRALMLHNQNLLRYRSTRARLRALLRSGQVVALGGGALAVAGVGALGPEAVVAGVATAAAGGAATFVGSRRSKELPAPPPPLVPLPAAAPLADSTPGAAAVQRINGTRRQLAALLPTVDQIQPDAATELRRADASAAAATTVLIDRLRTLSQIARDGGGREPERIARVSMQSLAARLVEGAEAYDEMLAAVVALVSTASGQLTAGDTLRQPIQEMLAYTEGLRRVADTW